MPIPRAATWMAVAVCGAIGSLAGCGETRQNETPVYPVQGRILFDGTPAAGAKISLHRLGKTAGPKHYPRATVEEDGTFHLSTFVSKDGAPAGEYIMTVRWPDPQVVARDPYGESDVVPPDLLNGRFATPRRSNLRVTIPQEATRLVPVDLASEKVRGAKEYQLAVETGPKQ